MFVSLLVERIQHKTLFHSIFVKPHAWDEWDPEIVKKIAASADNPGRRHGIDAIDTLFVWLGKLEFDVEVGQL